MKIECFFSASIQLIQLTKTEILQNDKAYKD